MREAQSKPGDLEPRPSDAAGLDERARASVPSASATDREESATPPSRGPLTLLLSALIPILFALGAFYFATQHDATPSAVTTGDLVVAAGTILATVDSRSTSQDPTLEFPEGTKEADLLVWDYAAEDGDWVRVEANDVPVGEAFPIFHAPTRIRVPVGTTFKVIGVKDGGGGGVTYAVNVPSLRTTILNGTDVGAANTYSLKTRPSSGIP